MPIQHSLNDYPPNWPEIARDVKAQAGNRCIRCGHAHDPMNGYMLTVHHLDMDKANCAWWNLIAVCQRCHLHIQGRVIMSRPWMLEHTDWFVPYVAGYYANRYGYPQDRKWVTDHAHALIFIGQGRLPVDALR